VRFVAEDLSDRIAGLAAMNPEPFATLVRDSVGPDADPGLWDALLSPSLISRTRAALSGVDGDLLAQMAQKNSDLDEIRARCLALGRAGYQEFAEARAEQAEWRGRVQGYRRLVLRRMAQAKTAAQAAHADRAQPAMAPGFTKSARRHNNRALEELARAVITHKLAVAGGDGDEGDDDALWEALTSVTVVTATWGEVTLADWIDRLDDLREEGEDAGE
jgi:hypothetical protein